MKSLLQILLFIFLGSPCYAADIDKIFANSDAMYDYARSLQFDLSDDSAAYLLKYSHELLADAKKAKTEDDKIESAMNAWFAAVYADMQNNRPYPPKNVKLEEKIKTSILKIGKLLGMSGNAMKYIRPTIDYLNGKLPERCGVNKGSTPMVGDINMIILDNGIGQTRTMYYHTPKNEEEIDCGKIYGNICYQVLNTMPVTPVMRQSGAQGNTMIFIHQCVAPD